MAEKLTCLLRRQKNQPVYYDGRKMSSSIMAEKSTCLWGWQKNQPADNVSLHEMQVKLKRFYLRYNEERLHVMVKYWTAVSLSLKLKAGENKRLKYLRTGTEKLERNSSASIFIAEKTCLLKSQFRKHDTLFNFSI